MGIKPASVVFWLSLVAELGLVTYLAIWPVRDSIKHARSLQDWLSLYSVDSNLDVWLLCIAHCLLLPLCFLRVAGARLPAQEALWPRQAHSQPVGLHMPGAVPPALPWASVCENLTDGHVVLLTLPDVVTRYCCSWHCWQRLC